MAPSSIEEWMALARLNRAIESPGPYAVQEVRAAHAALTEIQNNQPDPDRGRLLTSLDRLIAQLPPPN